MIHFETGRSTDLEAHGYSKAVANLQQYHLFNILSLLGFILAILIVIHRRVFFFYLTEAETAFMINSKVVFYTQTVVLRVARQFAIVQGSFGSV